jgi:peptidoglycan/xylan/chitin deacetylase (PgdA/CDA1 family)
MQYYNASRFNGADFADYVIDAFEWLKREGETAPKMMSVGLHLRMIGRPGRIGALERILAHLTASGAAWIAPRAAIARHWMTAVPAGV